MQANREELVERVARFLEPEIMAHTGKHWKWRQDQERKYAARLIDETGIAELTQAPAVAGASDALREALERARVECQTIIDCKLAGDYNARKAIEIIDQALSRPAEPAQGEVTEAAEFLCARLRDLESDILDDEVGRQYYGHVAPARARLEDAMQAAAGGGR